MKLTRRAATVGLAVLLALDIALVAVAIRASAPSRVTVADAATASEAASGSPAPATSTTPAPSTAASSTTGSPSPPATAARPAAPVQTRVVAVDGSTAWRATLGSCEGGGAALSVSTDGGASWTARPAPAGTVARLVPSSADRALVVAAGQGCGLGVYSTTDGGARWSAPAGIVDVWAPDPKDPTTVHSPGGRTSKPCPGGPVLDLARLSPTAGQALCADGTVQTSVDTGRSWQAEGTVPGGIAMDDRTEQAGVTAYVVALQGCAGLAVVRVRAGTAPAQLGCVEVPPATVLPGSVSLSVVGNNGWLAVADQTWRSRDGMRTWTRA